MKYIATTKQCKSKKEFIEILKKGDYNIWNESRIKALTNFSNGTFEDWAKWMNRNKLMFCTYQEFQEITAISRP